MTKKKSKAYVRPLVVILKGQKSYLAETCDGQHRRAVFREIMAEIAAEDIVSLNNLHNT